MLFLLSLAHLKCNLFAHVGETLRNTANFKWLVSSSLSHEMLMQRLSVSLSSPATGVPLLTLTHRAVRKLSQSHGGEIISSSLRSQSEWQSQ